MQRKWPCTLKLLKFIELCDAVNQRLRFTELRMYVEEPKHHILHNVQISNRKYFTKKDRIETFFLDFSCFIDEVVMIGSAVQTLLHTHAPQEIVFPLVVLSDRIWRYHFAKTWSLILSWTQEDWCVWHIAYCEIFPGNIVVFLAATMHVGT